MQLKINGKKVFFSSIGSGKQLLILPGWMHDHVVWQHVQTVLSHNFQVTVLDFPGFGESERDPSIKDLNDYAHFLTKVTRELSLKDFTILGHSFGGAVAIKTLALSKDLPVNKLILTDSSGIRRLHPKKIIGLFLAKSGKVAFSLPGLRRFRNPARRFLYNTIKETDYLDSGPLKQTFVRVVNDNIEGLLDKINNKTLIIWGQNDNVTPMSEAKIINAKIKNSKVTVINNATHFPFLEKPEEFCKIVTDFINE